MNGEDIKRVLGTDPDSTAEQIRAAYLKKLPSVHPEDDPEGFRELREAYETALKSLETESVDDSASGEIMRRLEAVVRPFGKRVDPAEWLKILGGDLDITTLAELSEKLLRRLMDVDNIPQRVWVALDEIFGWSEQELRLKQTFPERYVDFVLRGIKFTEPIRSEFFTSKRKSAYELLIKRCQRMQAQIRDRDIRGAKSTAAEIEKMNLPHPDVYALEVSLFQMARQHKTAEKILARMLAEFPDDLETLAKAGDYYADTDRPDKALPLLTRVLDQSPGHYNARVAMATVFNKTGRFEDAKNECMRLFYEYPYNNYINAMMITLSENLIPVYRARYEQNPEDQDARYKYAACLFNRERLDECRAILEQSPPDAEHTAKHCELMFDILSQGEIEDRGEMERLLGTWEAHEPDRMRLRNLPQKLYDLGDFDAAARKAALYLEEFPNDPIILYTLMLLARDADDLPAALKLGETALRHHPDDVRVISMLAETHARLGNISSAVDLARTALFFQPGFLEMRLLILKVFFDNDDYDAMIACCDDAGKHGLDCRETDIFRYIAEASKAQGEGDYETAVKVYTKLLKIDRQARHYVMRGIAHSWLDDTAAEIRDYQAALAIDPDDAFALFRLGMAYYYADKLEKSRETLSRSLEIDPDHETVWFFLIKACSESGEFAAATAAVERAVKIFTDPQTRLRLHREYLDACLHNHEYRLAYALKELSLSDDDSLNAIPLRQLGTSAYELGLDDEADAFYRRAVAVGEDEWEVWHGYAYFLEHGKRDLPAAVDAYTRAIKLRPNFWGDLIRQGQILKKMRKKISAARRFNKAKTLLHNEIKRNDYPCAHYFLGECLFELGELDAAEKEFARAVKMSAKYQPCVKHVCYEAYFSLAKLFKIKGDRETARKYYKKTLSISNDREYRNQYF